MIRQSDLVELPHRDCCCFSLICNERLVDAKGLFVVGERLPPLLHTFWLRISRFYFDQEPALKVQYCVDIQEYVVHHIPRYHSLLLDRFLQLVQILEILDIFALGVYQFSNDMISVSHFPSCHSCWYRVTFLGSHKQATFFCSIEDYVYNLGDLEIRSCQHLCSEARDIEV